MRLMGYLCGVTAPLFVAAAAEGAAITVVPAELYIGPNQKVQISVSGTEQVFGFDLFLQIEDGGEYIGGAAAAPVITHVDLITGTIFAGNNAGQADVDVHPMVYAGAVATSTGTVLASGLLATITLDTTGLDPGAFVLRTKGVADQYNTQLTDTSGARISLSQPDSVSIAVVVPEPAALLAMSVVSALALIQRPVNRR